MLASYKCNFQVHSLSQFIFSGLTTCLHFGFFDTKMNGAQTPLPPTPLVLAEFHRSRVKGGDF